MFDSRCGMFYEPLSNFFYDPKTKLYFSHKKQKYFMHKPGESPAFQPIDSSAGQSQAVANDTGGTTSTTAAADASSGGVKSETPTVDGQPPAEKSRNADTDVPPPKSENKNKIAISIGGGFLGKKPLSGKHDSDSGKASPTAEGGSPGEGPKKVVPVVQIVQMKKKVAKNIEKWNHKVGDKLEAPQKNLAVKDLNDGEIKRTTDGKPICVLW
jgi:hypothetical protein